jgi:hypothetical protein
MKCFTSNGMRQLLGRFLGLTSVAPGGAFLCPVATFIIVGVDASPSVMLVSPTMDGFCKLHAKIINSSIWNAPDHCRLLWITMLASADASGNVEGSVGGLAHMARISHEHAKEALEMLSGPDPDSGDETTGERIRKIAPGIWHIINHGRYRERQTRRQALQAQASKNYRARKTDDASSESSSSVYVSDVSVSDSSVPKKKKPPKGDVDVWEGFQEFWDAFAHKQNRPDSEKVWNRLKPNEELRAAIMSKVRAYVGSTPDKQYRKHPAAWLRARKWEDEIVVKGQLALINGNRGHMPHDTRLKDYSDTGMDD